MEIHNPIIFMSLESYTYSPFSIESTSTACCWEKIKKVYPVALHTLKNINSQSR